MLSLFTIQGFLCVFGKWLLVFRTQLLIIFETIKRINSEYWMSNFPSSFRKSSFLGSCYALLKSNYLCGAFWSLHQLKDGVANFFFFMFGTSWQHSFLFWALQEKAALFPTHGLTCYILTILLFPETVSFLSHLRLASGRTKVLQSEPIKQMKEAFYNHMSCMACSEHWLKPTSFSAEIFENVWLRISCNIQFTQTIHGFANAGISGCNLEVPEKIF